MAYDARANNGALAGSYIPPIFVIDLSLPPRDRYRELAKLYNFEVQDLIGLFDDLLLDLAIPEKLLPTVNRLTRMVLRRLHDAEQTEELRGISEETKVPMYLLVAFNVILDVLMGCTSGAVRTGSSRSRGNTKMLHFRTLDWTMDPLRKVVVQLHFIRSSSKEPDRVLARSVTYVGFVGVLTGVRPGLSMSLNFRGVHDNSSKKTQFRYYLHHILVLLGRRPSIATHLRQLLIGDVEQIERINRKYSAAVQESGEEPRPATKLAEVYSTIEPLHTTAAYLIFSDGDSAISLDKDFGTAKIRRSNNFIATTNHDVLEHGNVQQENSMMAPIIQQAARHVAGLEEFMEESEDRLECLIERWRKVVARRKRYAASKGQQLTMHEAAAQTSVTQNKVIDWLTTYPTTNECTHFAAVMDPSQGTVAWCLAYPEPLSQEQMQEGI